MSASASGVIESSRTSQIIELAAPLITGGMNDAQKQRIFQILQDLKNYFPQIPLREIRTIIQEVSIEQISDEEKIQRFESRAVELVQRYLEIFFQRERQRSQRQIDEARLAAADMQVQRANEDLQMEIVKKYLQLGESPVADCCTIS